jgi:FkbM family methyltransferase
MNKFKNAFFAKWQRVITAGRDPELKLESKCGKYYIPNLSEIFPDRKLICVDVGSAQGYFSTLQEAAFDEIYCFEPNYINFKKAMRNVSEKNLFNKIAVFNFCATGSQKSGDIIDFTFDDRCSPYGSSIVESSANLNCSHSVMCIGLPQIFKFINYNFIHYLKCDIEGSEYDFLYGEDLTNIGILSMEFHSKILGKRTQKLIEYIINQGFQTKKTEKGINFEMTFINCQLS